MLQAGSVAGVFLICAPFASARKSHATDSSADPIAPAPRATLILDSGFRDLYKLDFRAARDQFRDYQKEQPTDPLGEAAEAATYLYEEFNAKGVLTSKFFLDDDRFLGGVDRSA